MRILLTNDDGYNAEGINSLYKALEERGHEVYMLAPHTQQSGKSHAMTVSGSFLLHRHSDRVWSVEGTPVDCVIVARSTKDLMPQPDIVVSGINHGYNLSTDTIYSGTCGAARQATLYGIKAIAMSQDKGDSGYDFPRLASFLGDNLEKLASLISDGSFLNLNFPPLWNGRVEKAILGRKHYYDTFQMERVEEGTYRLTVGDLREENDPSIDSCLPYDYEVCDEGSASLTLLSISPSIAGEAMETLVFDL